MATFASVFNQRFGEMLKPYGFKKIKGGSYFVKLINNEILQFISFRNFRSGYKNYKECTIYAGALSVYSESLNPKSFEINSTDIIRYAYVSGKPTDGLFSLVYNEENLQEIVAFATNKTEEIILPVFEKIIDLDSYIEYRKFYYEGPLLFAEKFREDSLVLIKADNHDDFEDVFEESFCASLLINPQAYADKNNYDKLYKGLRECIVENIAHSRDKVYNDPELYKKALDEIERRRQLNTEILRSYGLDL